MEVVELMRLPNRTGMPLAVVPQRPLGLSIGGGKPYPYVLTIKGKPLGINPMRVNPTVCWPRALDGCV